MSDNPSKDSPSTGAGRFATTHWSVVLTAGQPESTGYRQALEALCETYWFPLYAYLRRHGNDTHQAEDYTQAFLAFLLDKHGLRVADPKRGRFRSFLLASLKNFLADEWGRAKAQKRGGHIKLYSLDVDDGDTRYSREPVDDLSAEKLFERSWARAVLAQAMTRLKAELAASHRQGLFDHLKAYLTAEENAVAYRDAAAAMGMTEGAVKVAVHRLRRRYGELVREGIAQTVATTEQVDEELNALYGALAG
jgi:DNA-directed RNA polymerase specialized sigma24 family protein